MTQRERHVLVGVGGARPSRVVAPPALIAQFMSPLTFRCACSYFHRPSNVGLSPMKTAMIIPYPIPSDTVELRGVLVLCVSLARRCTRRLPLPAPLDVTVSAFHWS